MSARERLAAFVTNFDKPIYALRGLPPEVVAVLFALVSRSAAGFRDNLLTLMEENLGLPAVTIPTEEGFDQARASAFHEKWVLGYGHASVAEHAVLHFAVEGLSILAAKVLEDARLASFTEKSSRYQVFDLDHFHWPKEWLSSRHQVEIRQLVGALFEAYGRCYREECQRLDQETGELQGLSARARQQTLHAAACDTARYLLPAGARTSLGMTLNARAAAHLIRKLRAHPLAELNAIADCLEEEGRQVTPVLLKYATPSDWQLQWEKNLDPLLPGLDETERVSPPRVRLVDWDPDAESRILADLLVLLRSLGLEDARQRVAALPEEQRNAWLRQVLQGMGPHDSPPRSLEQAYVTVEFCVDYGAFRDLQRHRMLTPTVPVLGCRWGWELPEGLDMPRRTEIEALLNQARDLWSLVVRENEAAAAYLVPMAFRQRFVLRMNLRQCEHLIRLRSAPAGHPSYRSAAQELHRQLAAVYPNLGGWLRVSRDVGSLARTREVAREDQSRRDSLGRTGEA